jgi:hypothetical protein
MTLDCRLTVSWGILVVFLKVIIASDTWYV